MSEQSFPFMSYALHCYLTSGFFPHFFFLFPHNLLFFLSPLLSLLLFHYLLFYCFTTHLLVGKSPEILGQCSSHCIYKIVHIHKSYFQKSAARIRNRRSESQTGQKYIETSLRERGEQINLQRLLRATKLSLMNSPLRQLSPFNLNMHACNCKCLKFMLEKYEF